MNECRDFYEIVCALENTQEIFYFSSETLIVGVKSPPDIGC